MGDNEYYEFDYDALKTKVDQFYSDVCKGNLTYIEEEELEEIIEFCLEEDEATKAYEISEAALILHPNHPVFLLQKADSLVELNRFEEAKELLDNNVSIEETPIISSCNLRSISNRIVLMKQRRYCLMH